MVQSRLDPTLTYTEPTGAPVDPAVETDECPRYILHQLAPGGLDHRVAIGRINYLSRPTGRLAILNIYLLNDGQIVVRCIGVYEYWDWEVPALTGSTKLVGGVRVPYNLGDRPPLFFESVTAEYMRSAHTAAQLRQPMAPAAPRGAEPPAKKARKAVEEEEEEEEDKKRSKKKKASGKLTRVSIFEPTTGSAALLAAKRASPSAVLDTWATQRAQTERAQESFRPAESDTWVQKFLKSRTYTNVRNDGAGDCLFLALVQAYARAGAQTSVAMLRAVLAQEATQSDFEDKRVVFDAAHKEYETTKQKVEKLREEYTAAATKLGAPDGMTKDERRALRAEAERLAAAHKSARTELAAAKENYADTAWMDKIDSLEAMRAMVQTREYYADEWAISILERFLRLKMVILEQQGSSGRLRCGEAVADDAAPPLHYVLLEFMPAPRMHYELVTTADGGLFDFVQLPTAIKMLIVDTCVSRGGGGGYGSEFRQLVASGGGDAEVSGGAAAATVLALSPDKAWDDTAPGKAEFESGGAGMQQLRNHKRWRRILDDSWHKAPFTASVDGSEELRWASVVHFLAAAPLHAAGKNNEFRMFSISTPTTTGSSLLATNPKVALRAVTAAPKKKSGDTEQGLYYDEHYMRGLQKVDLAALRLTALRAKFGQSADLRTMLLLTGDARLQTVVRGKPPMVDTALMQVRDELAK